MSWPPTCAGRRAPVHARQLHLERRTAGDRSTAARAVSATMATRPCSAACAAGRRRACWPGPDAARGALRPDARRSRPPRAAPRAGLQPPSRWPCTLTRSGELPLEIPLFAEPEAQVVVFSAPTSTPAARRRRSSSSGSTATADVHERAAAPAPEHASGPLLCEGGPRVFGRLAHEAARRPAVPDPGVDARRRWQRARDHLRAAAAHARQAAARGSTGARRNAFFYAMG